MRDSKATLLIEEIQKTIERLLLRIEDRFPQSGLSSVCRHLDEISKETNQTVRWISRPNYPLRLCVYSLILLLGIILVISIQNFHVNLNDLTWIDVISMSESIINEVIWIGAGIVFLVTLETRRKRHRVINAINRLRSIAHIIDAHQLTKDPAGISKINLSTAHSPSRELSDYNLCRYLDYCSEMLSLVSKVGFLYVQNFDDSIANNSVNELENLADGLSRKIWQKIMIIQLSMNNSK